ncbi:PAS domain S-box protein [Rhizobium cauense]|uniref:hybrid sensor histidine kinase/response regulator n=1 Tax=Rhizobium cauense TaxID=1166683 RepID=UPI001C6F2B3C|nr:PAS domain-containing sensor histidine kinase [Rhizobium cauense]MBW9115640.1 PAS domain S-box protein [Rhizobium cauense]
MNAATIDRTEIAAEDRYRLLVDNITDYAIYMLDPAGYVSSWNAGAWRFKGYTEEEIVGEHFSRFYTEADRASGLPQKALATAASIGRFEAEGWRVRKNGEHFWAHVVIDAIRNAQGELIGFAKITRDLSERRIAQENLSKSEEQFRLLVQSVTDYAIYMLDPKGSVSSWNAGARRIKGYEPDEIIGKHFSQFYTDEDKAAGLPETALKIAAAEGRFEREGWRVRKGGTRFWANVIIDAIRAEDGSLIGFAKITRDITEKRQAQEALEQAQRDLFQAQKMEAVGQLTGGIAHDFNNLLMAVLGSLEIAQKRAIAGRDNRDLINNAIEGAKRGAALTQRLLAFSRKQELKLDAVDLANLVIGMTSLVQRSIGPAIELRTSVPASLPAVHADANQLESALLNLVVNARDAMPNGGVIQLSARKQLLRTGDVEHLPGGVYVCLSVADEGEGMSADTLQKAIAPFFTTKGVGKGTGLGLPMVQGLMAQAGGALVLKSSPGQGTTAELWLPLAAQGEEKEEQEGPEVPATGIGRALNVLVVDDDPLVLMNTVLMLEDLGHATVQASSAEEALTILQDGPLPDLVVTDHAMPRMTGGELAKVLDERLPGLPVILATGYAEVPGGISQELPRLAKPFTQAQLEAAVLSAAS